MAANRYAFIKAGWHSDIVDRALEGFCEVISAEHVDVVDVPGAFELPLMAQELALTGRYAAIAAAALVVDGGIYRHDFVAQAVVDGLMRVGLILRYQCSPYPSLLIISKRRITTVRSSATTSLKKDARRLALL